MKFENIELPILAQNALGAYVQLSLRWPERLSLPLPGERLQLHNGDILYPMLSPHPGRLEALSPLTHPDSNLKLAAVTGECITLSNSQPVVILAAGIALATLIHLCSTRRGAAARTLALYQMNDPAPFRPRPSRFLLDAMPPGVIAAIPLLEDWGIPSRLCHPQAHAGCFEGTLDEFFATLPPDAERLSIRLDVTQ